MIVVSVFVVVALTTLVVIAALLVRRHNNAQRHRRDVERHIRDDLLDDASSDGSDSVRGSDELHSVPAPAGHPDAPTSGPNTSVNATNSAPPPTRGFSRNPSQTGSGFRYSDNYGRYYYHNDRRYDSRVFEPQRGADRPSNAAPAQSDVALEPALPSALKKK